MARRIELHSPVGPILLGPLPDDTLRRLRNASDSLNLVEGAKHLPHAWSIERKAICHVLCKLIEAHLATPSTLAGLLPGFQLVFAFATDGEVNADASNITSNLGIANRDVAQKPGYLIRIDLTLVALAEQVATQTIWELTQANLNALLGISGTPDRRTIALHVAWMSLLQVFFHELGHVLRGHLLRPRSVPPGIMAPPDVNLDLIDELDADVFANAALANVLGGMRSMVPAGAPATNYQFVVGALAGRSLFGSLAIKYGTAASSTHPTKPVRALWTVRDIGAHFGVPEAVVVRFLQIVDCTFGASDAALQTEQTRQAGAWTAWKTLHNQGFYRKYFSDTSPA